MIFFMGWSSIAVASIKNTTHHDHSNAHKHMNMSVSSSNSLHHLSNIDYSTHCQKHTSIKSDMNDCQIMKHDSRSHLNCKDCSANFCQSSLSCLDVSETLASMTRVLNDYIPVLNSTYLVQYSKGYKRDLLRPPQA